MTERKHAQALGCSGSQDAAQPGPSRLLQFKRELAGLSYADQVAALRPPEPSRRTAVSARSPDDRGAPVQMAVDDSVPRMAVPATPNGMSLRDFGQIMRWGTGSDTARAAIAGHNAEALRQAGVTKALAQAWAAFYENESRRNPDNPSAPGRADLMRAVANML